MMTVISSLIHRFCVPLEWYHFIANMSSVLTIERCFQKGYRDNARKVGRGDTKRWRRLFGLFRGAHYDRRGEGASTWRRRYAHETLS